MFAPSFCGGSHSYFQDEGKSNQVKRRPTKMVFPTSNIHSKGKADSTRRCSQAVPHPSTNRALRRLTSEVGRDPVYSTRYGRQREKDSTLGHTFERWGNSKNQPSAGSEYFGPTFLTTPSGTVAILAQGTSWAVASTQAFWPRFKSARRDIGKSTWL